MAVTVGEVVKVLAEWAPVSLKESWDNPGLLVGSPDEPVQKIMVTLDVMRDSVDYAVAHGVNLIVSHHPIIFSGIKALRSDTYDGEMYQKLLAHHISVYSAHTNLDSADGGVNDVLARRLGLREVTGLVPGVKEPLYKVAVYVPESHSDAVRQAMAAAGAGYTGNYSDCSFTVKGDGRFKPRAGTNPFIGSVGTVETVREERIETIVPQPKLPALLSAVLQVHPYEEPAYDVYPLANEGHQYAMGRVGLWPTPEPAGIVLQKIKRALKRDVLPFAGDADTMVTKVALLGGAGAGFMKLAKEAGAQLYLTGDIRYHDAQEAVKLGIVAADGGHFGTEYPVVSDLQERLRAAGRERKWAVECISDPTSRDMFHYIK